MLFATAKLQHLLSHRICTADPLCVAIAGELNSGYVASVCAAVEMEVEGLPLGPHAGATEVDPRGRVELCDAHLRFAGKIGWVGGVGEEVVNLINGVASRVCFVTVHLPSTLSPTLGYGSHGTKRTDARPFAVRLARPAQAAS